MFSLKCMVILKQNDHLNCWTSKFAARWFYCEAFVPFPEEGMLWPSMVWTLLSAPFSSLICLCVWAPAMQECSGHLHSLLLRSGMLSQAPYICPLPNQYLLFLSDLSSHMTPEIGTSPPFLYSYHSKSCCNYLFHACPLCQGIVANGRNSVCLAS